MAQPDDDLISQFTHGDTGAFSAIYLEYYPTLYSFVKKFILEKEDAEDITADIFAKLWQMRDRFESIKNIEAFLYITGRNACLDFLRTLKRRNEKQKDLIYTLLQEPMEGTLPEDIKTEVLKKIYEEIEKLPKSCRNVFKMAYLQDWSNSEIAASLQINNQSVRNHKLRAIKLLRMTLLAKKLLISLFAGICCLYMG